MSEVEYTNIKGIKRKDEPFKTWEQVKKAKSTSKPKITKGKKNDTSGSSEGD